MSAYRYYRRAMLALVTVMMMSGAADAPLVDRPVTLMTRSELKAERRRLEAERPIIALPATMQVVGALLAVIGLSAVIYMASNPSQLEWNVFGRGDTGIFWAAGAATVGLGLLVPGLWLFLRARPEHRAMSERLAAINDRLSEPFECYERYPEAPAVVVPPVGP